NASRLARCRRSSRRCASGQLRPPDSACCPAPAACVAGGVAPTTPSGLQPPIHERRTLMTNPNGMATPKKALAGQIDRLEGILDGLAEALGGAVADAVRDTVGSAAREAVCQAVAETLALRQRDDRIPDGARPDEGATDSPSREAARSPL